MVVFFTALANQAYMHADADQGNFTPKPENEAWTKLWVIYLKEAERYDSAFRQRWKADTGGMLILVRVDYTWWRVRLVRLSYKGYYTGN